MAIYTSPLLRGPETGRPGEEGGVIIGQTSSSATERQRETSRYEENNEPLVCQKEETVTSVLH